MLHPVLVTNHLEFIAQCSKIHFCSFSHSNGGYFLAWFNLHEISLSPSRSLSSQSLSLPIYVLIGSSRHNTNCRTFPLSPPSPPITSSLPFYLRGFGSCRKPKEERSAKHTLLLVSLISFSKARGRRRCWEEKGRKRGICFHCSVVKPWLDHKGILPPVTEKVFHTYFTCFYLSWQVMCVIGEAVIPI